MNLTNSDSDFCKHMIPIHLKEARREIDAGNLYGAETHIAIAEAMIDGSWFNKKKEI